MRIGLLSKALLPTFLIPILTSCILQKLKKDVDTLEEIQEIYGKVNMPDELPGQLIAVAFAASGSKEVAVNYRVVDPRLKQFAIFLDPGIYRFALVHDLDADFVVDEGEPVYLHNRGHRVKFSEVVQRVNLEDLTLPTDGTLPENYERDLTGISQEVLDAFEFPFGKKMDLNAPRFSKENGKLGLWQPTKFMTRCGMGLYWFEPYDPKRVPVLFVSGAGGSVQEWRYFFERLDTSKFQAWYWLYPSGLPITNLGYNLHRWIEEMARMYEFDRIYIVAHSMGGLVSREGIVHLIEPQDPNENTQTLVKKFISISTPWNGHRLAKKGVRRLSVPIPSWHDVVPGSLFLRNVFNTPLKSRVDHHLLFGYSDDSGDDGTVALDSMLLENAQVDAVDVHGFKADHVGILFKDEVFEYVQDILYRSEEALTEFQNRDTQGEVQALATVARATGIENTSPKEDRAFEGTNADNVQDQSEKLAIEIVNKEIE